MAKIPAKTIKEHYFEAVGRRKTSVARVRLHLKRPGITVNGVDFKAYFKLPKFQELVGAPLELLKFSDKMGAEVRVFGGGLTGQAEAVRHGLSRALVKFSEEHRKKLRDAGFMTRDPRMVERKKYGLKKARRAPQWAKR